MQAILLSRHPLNNLSLPPMAKSDGKMVGLLMAWILGTRAFFYYYVPYFDPFLLLHHLDSSWLRENLWESVYYLHAQPPLFNLILGGLLKATPLGSESMVFTIFFLLLAVRIGVMAYSLLRCFNISPRAAIIVSALFLLIPQERWLNYNIYFVSFLMLAATLSLYRYFRSAKMLPLFIFGLASASIVWSRSFFHLVFWLVPLIGLILWTKKKRSFVVIMMGVLLLGALPYVKNNVEFGFFGGSSWLGMNMANMTRYVKEEAIQKSIESGEVTPLIQIEHFAPVKVYQNYYGLESKTGIEVLDAQEKSNGTVNANHSIYLRASEEYKRNTLALIKKYPGAYTKAVFNEFYIIMGFIPYKFFDTYPDWHINQITSNAQLNKAIGIVDAFVLVGFMLSWKRTYA